MEPSPYTPPEAGLERNLAHANFAGPGFPLEVERVSRWRRRFQIRSAEGAEIARVEPELRNFKRSLRLSLPEGDTLLVPGSSGHYRWILPDAEVQLGVFNAWYPAIGLTIRPPWRAVGRSEGVQLQRLKSPPPDLLGAGSLSTQVVTHRGAPLLLVRRPFFSQRASLSLIAPTATPVEAWLATICVVLQML